MPRLALFFAAAAPLVFASAGTPAPAGACTFNDIRTQPATGITQMSATLNATATMGDCQTNRRSEYGTNPTLAGASTSASAANGTGAYSVTVTGLAPGTTYFRAEAAGTDDNVILSFTPLAQDSTQQPVPPGSEPADVGVILVHGPASAFVGEDVTYTITVQNNGPAQAINVVVTDTLPAALVFVSASSTQGTCTGTATVTCTIGTLNNGATATVTLVARAVAAGTITNQASVGASNPDPNVGDNQHSSGPTTVTSLASKRRITLSFNGRVASGRVSADDGFGACIAGVLVRLQRRVGDRWASVALMRTNGAGRYTRRLARGGTFRATAPAFRAGDHTCGAATSPTRRSG